MYNANVNRLCKAQVVCHIAVLLSISCYEKLWETIMTFLDLKQKEVINCKDCKRIGFVADVEIDPCSGQICALIVPAPVHLFSCFGKNEKYYIRFCDVVRIGPDIVLVDVCLDNVIINDE